MENLVTIIHVVVSLAVIGLVLVQHGKGADAELHLEEILQAVCLVHKALVIL